MAKSASFYMDTSSTSGAHYGSRYFSVSCTQRKDVANNKSYIDWKLSAVGDSTWYDTGPTTLKIGGVQVYYKDRVGWGTGTFPAAQGSVEDTVEIKHNDNGSKEISVELTTAVWHGAASAGTASKSWELEDIPRASDIDSFECSTNYINGRLTTKFTPKASSFYYKLKLFHSSTLIHEETLGNKSTTQQTINYTFNQNELNRILESSSIYSEQVSISAIIETYGDSAYSNKIGESSKKTLTLNLTSRTSEIDSFECSTNYINGRLTTKFTPKVSGFYYILKLFLSNTLIHEEVLGNKAKNQQTINYTFNQSEIDRILENSSISSEQVSISAVIETCGDSAYSKKMGESSRKTLTLTLPLNIVPSINDVTIEEGVEEINEKFGVYLQNKSKLKINIDASGIYSSTISSYKTIVNGYVYEGKSIVTEPLIESGRTFIEVIVTDTRGRSATTKKEINVVEYQDPKSTIFTVVRDETNPSKAKITINATISGINQKNDKKFTLKYKKQREEEYVTQELDNSFYNLNTSFELNNIYADNSYNFVLEIEDYFKKISSRVFLLLNLDKNTDESFTNPQEKEIELLIYNTNFEKLGTITDAESIIWYKKYNDVGEFEIYLPASSNNTSLLKEDFYVVREDDDAVGIIENFHISYDETNETDMISVSGRFAESLLERRIIWKQTQINGNLEHCIRSLITDNVINPTIPERKIPIIKLGNLKGFTEKIKSQYTGDNLSKVIHDICNVNGIGYHLLLGDGNFYFELYKGIDSTYNQIENPHIIFSDEYDNLISSKYQANKSNYKNTALVAGEGEGLERTTVAINNENSGLNRREIFVDARDLSTNDEEIDANEYNNMLQARGSEKLSEHQYVTSFDGEIRLDDRYKYKIDVDLGDTVIVENTEWGVYKTQIITGVIESYDSAGYSISLEFNS